MKNYLILFAFLCSANVTFAQSEMSDSGYVKLKIDPMTKPHIRSGSSFSGKQPIYIIDGFKLDSTVFLKGMNPNDIKSIDILKDMASNEKYGDKNHEGVILITTKNSNSRKWKKILKKSGQKVVFDT